MQTKLATFKNGNKMSLELSIPEVQRQFNQLHREMKTYNVTIAEGFTRYNERFDTILLQGWWSWDRGLVGGCWLQEFQQEDKRWRMRRTMKTLGWQMGT
jgi:hypothetical protein